MGSEQQRTFFPIPQWRHEVKEGDTIYNIAQRFKVSQDTLMDLNGLKNPEELQLGSIIALRDIDEDAQRALLLKSEIPSFDEMKAIKNNIFLLRRETEAQLDTIVDNVVQSLLRSPQPLVRRRQINDFFQKYFGEKTNLLSTEVKGRVLLHLARERLLTDEPFTYFEQIKNCSLLQDILIAIARPGGLILNVGGVSIGNSERVFQDFSHYSSYPWAVNVLAETLKFDDVTVFDQRLVRYGINLDDNQKKSIDEFKDRFSRLRELGTQIIGSQVVRDEPEKLNNFLFDDTLANVVDIKDDWLMNAIKNVAGFEDFFPQGQRLLSSDFGFLNFKLIIARNLYFSKEKKISQEIVQQYTKKVIDLWKNYKDVPLFSGRNVLVLAHAERVGNGNDNFSFAKEPYMTSIREQGGNLVTLARPKDASSLLATNAEASIAFIETPGPFTSISDGHGADNAWYFSEDTGVGYERITAGQLSRKYLRRVANYGEILKFEERDFLINNSCLATNQNEKFLKGCIRRGIQEGPVLFSPSEYGQNIQYDRVDPRVNPFMNNIFLENRSPDGTIHPTTFGHLILANSQGRYNPSIYTIFGGRIFQIL